MEHLAAVISFIVVFVGGGVFYAALPVVDPSLAVSGVGVNQKIRRLETHNRYLQTKHNTQTIPKKDKSN